MPDAVVIGAGPNGLVAANRLVDAGWSVHVLEAQSEPGGAVRSSEALEPGYVIDHCSAFYPLAAASPTIRELELDRFGLRWLHGPFVVAHPSGDGSCVVLSRDLAETAASLDTFARGDGDAWRKLFAFWRRIAHAGLDMLVTPIPPVIPTLRLLPALARYGYARTARLALLSVRRFGEEHSEGDGGRRLIAGNALHADVTPETAIGGFYGFVLCALGQDVGFPVPAGGAGKLTDALVRRLHERGGRIECEAPAERIVVRRGRAVAVRTADGREVGARRAVLAAVDAPQLYLRLLDRADVPASVLADIRRFEWDWSTVKIDWTLDGPIPWSAPEARRAPVVHVTDSVDALTVQASQLRLGLIPERPFLIFGQYSMVDAARQPQGKETAWAYMHVPQHVRGDAGGALSGRWDAAELDELAGRCEEEIEKLAPGFRALVRKRRVAGPGQLEAEDANLVGGALNGGSAQLHQQRLPAAPRSRTTGHSCSRAVPRLGVGAPRRRRTRGPGRDRGARERRRRRRRRLERHRPRDGDQVRPRTLERRAGRARRRRSGAATREVEAAGGRALALSVDASDAAAIDDAASRVEDALGPIDVWVNSVMTGVSLCSPTPNRTSSGRRTRRRTSARRGGSARRCAGWCRATAARSSRSGP
jgi:phytoene dehydrogenase-like protein